MSLRISNRWRMSYCWHYVEVGNTCTWKVCTQLQNVVQVIWFKCKQLLFLSHWKCRILYRKNAICGKLYYFFLKKSAAESHRLLVEAYKEYAPSVSMCEKWFKRFRSNDFDLDDKKHGKPPKKFEDAELQAETVWNHHWRSLSTTTDTFEPSFGRKTTGMEQ